MTRKAAWVIAVGFGVVTSTLAQYPGKVESSKKTAPAMRAVAVLEWTGPVGKPTASRIIPVAVFDGEQYQPGGLYLARPEPLAVEPGTEYVLQDAGVARGLFEVNSAQDVSGYWFGYGSWRPMAPPPKKPKPKQGRNMPQVVSSQDGRPHFKVRDDSGSSTNSSSSNSSSTSSSGSTDSTGSSAPAAKAPAGDPDRPTLRRRSDSSSSTETASTSSDTNAPETPITGGDPDRPHISRGKQNPTDDVQPTQLVGVPSGVEQMIAVSDAADREAHPFVYLWPDPGDAKKMQEQMELAASAAIAATEPPVKTPKPRATTPAQRRKAAAAPPPEPKALVFSNEVFKAYELTYSGGATLVFSGSAIGSTGKAKYVTLIAQPDFNGVPRVIFKSVTDDDHLDLTPKMRLVDAVDARANNRGDLVFELRSSHDREFVIYRVGNGQAEQVFTTGSLSNNAQG
jgi:hypothetical protein